MKPCKCGARVRKTSRRTLRAVGDTEVRPKVCKPIHWSFQTRKHGRKIDVEGFVDEDGDREMVIEGSLHLGPKFAKVGFIKQHGYPRCGYGTKLYEKFLQVACAKGKRLVSDTMRSEHSQGFWEKQVRKGRAICLSYDKPADKLAWDTFDKVGKWSCQQFAIKRAECETGGSLAGLRRRKKRKR